MRLPFLPHRRTAVQAVPLPFLNKLFCNCRFDCSSDHPMSEIVYLCEFEKIVLEASKLMSETGVLAGNNPENGRVTTATPPMCNSPLSIGGALFCQPKT